MSHVDPSVDFGDRKCVCGHEAGEHIDGEFQCVILECGCKEMVEMDYKESIDYRK